MDDLYANIDVEEFREDFDKSQLEGENLFRSFLPDFSDYFLSPENFDLIKRFYSRTCRRKSKTLCWEASRIWVRF